MQNNPRWFCERCAKPVSECQYVYNFTVLIGDCTDQIYANVLGESPGEQIVGCAASDLVELNKIDNKIKPVGFVPYGLDGEFVS